MLALHGAMVADGQADADGATLARVRARSLLLSFSSDWLYGPRYSEEIVRALGANGAEARHVMIDATYGHDSFLLEEARMTELIRDFLA